MSENTKAQRMSGTLAITNGSTSALNVTIEPWADQHDVTAGETLELVFEGPAGGRIEVEVKPDTLAVFAWPGATVSTRDAEPGNRR